jgi:hypothetical protein
MVPLLLLLLLLLLLVCFCDLWGPLDVRNVRSISCDACFLHMSVLCCAAAAAGGGDPPVQTVHKKSISWCTALPWGRVAVAGKQMRAGYACDCE